MTDSEAEGLINKLLNCRGIKQISDIYANIKEVRKLLRYDGIEPGNFISENSKYREKERNYNQVMK